MLEFFKFSQRKIGWSTMENQMTQKRSAHSLFLRQLAGAVSYRRPVRFADEN